MQSFFGALGAFTSFSLDVIVLAVIGVLLFVYTIYHGKSKMVGALLSFYAAIVLFNNFFFLNNVLLFRNSPGQIIISKLLIFAVFFGLILAAVKRATKSESSLGGSRGIASAVFLSLSGLILLLVLSYYTIPIEALYDFSPVIDKIFLAKNGVFWWLAAPLVVLFVTNRR